MQPSQFLDRIVYHNSLRAWAISIAVALAAFVALLLVRALLLGRLSAIAKRTTTDLDDILVEIVARTRPYFLAGAAAVVGSRFLVLPRRPMCTLPVLFRSCSSCSVGCGGRPQSTSGSVSD